MQAFLSLGSNIQPQWHLQQALKALEQQFGALRLSPTYRSPAEGFDGDDFLNLVVAFDSELEPLAIDRLLKAIEDRLGRQRGTAKFSARSIDIDLILQQGRVGRFGRLVLPRADIESYAFVLKPLADLEPDGVHPLLQERYVSLWKRLSEGAMADQALIPFDPPWAEDSG